MPRSNEKELHSVILPGEGVTDAERHLAKLCKRSFMSLWSYPAVFRDQGKKNGKGDGKEVCDVLVVFENHIIIFSDKDCEFRDTGNLEREWSRWYKKAVLKSADQVFGAERWIRRFPDRLFLDRQCTFRFPITLPDPKHAVFHRIVVAHSGARRCQEILGGSGSLMLDNTLVGGAHVNNPFTIGQINPAKGYVHVFDDTSLDIVMKTLDTIMDFTAYLTKKERLLTGNKTVSAAGEEELLAFYLSKLNRADEHDFVIQSDCDVVNFPEGLWQSFVSNPQRRAQVEQDRISYAWDALIEKFLFHGMTGSQYYQCGSPLKDQEMMYRLLAREPRMRRRLLCRNLDEMLESQKAWGVRVIASPEPCDPLYVFLFMKHPPDISDEDYRDVRASLLWNYCHVVKLRFTDATKIVGIATEAGNVEIGSEDLMYFDASHWSAKAKARAEEVQKRLGLLKGPNLNVSREYEYPFDHVGRVRRTTFSRNSPCSCGSGQRFKRCCGKGLFSKRP